LWKKARQKTPEKMNAQQINETGYAIPFYDSKKQVRIWRYAGKQYVLPADAVVMEKISGVPFMVARIEEVESALRRQ
jgi:hypothetical protein